MDEIDKQSMGLRIKQIRLQAGMRQWELARLLGTTQSAVHKYEHGVVPEPRRLLELAKVGNTSIEWLLTGRHWDSGSEERERLSPDVLRTAALLREIGADQRQSVDEALRIVREAVAELEDDGGTTSPPLDSRLLEHAPEALRVLESAWRIQRAVLRRVLGETAERLAAGAPRASAR
ncbi:MAG TPA: helix-turn-helix domain-containing protein [Candidatus Polarisedimenticolaceae bacterium]|nr:helix-turn-helix domain-containing protein [Candidatus Polarisedimenticolaceae bacterium]